MGRPKKHIDIKQFESMCAIQCTEKEICAVLGVSDKTLSAWCHRTYKKSFSEVFREKRELGKASLRRNQWKLAERNVSMAIFLGKNYLGQSDSPNNDDQEELFNKLDRIAEELHNASKTIE